MTENEKTPLEIANESIANLEKRSKGKLEGLTDKVKSSFWDNIKETLLLPFAFVWDGFVEVLDESMKFVGIDMLETQKQLTEEETTKKIHGIIEAYDDPEEMLVVLEAAANKIPLLGIAYTIVQYIMSAAGILTANLSGSMELAAQEIMKKLTPSIPTLDLLIESYFKSPETEDQVNDCFKRLGLSDDRVKIIMQGVRTLLSPDQAQAAYLREDITEADHDNILRAYKFNDTDIAQIKKLYEFIPGPSDLITMAVREVFSPDIVAKFGQMEGFPPDFAKWARKVGLTEFWARNFWAAHWTLPSITQGFEMMHRGVIDNDELDMLLKALDVMSFWRDRLKEISYNPLTRVDVRRMYALGVLDEEDVFRSYKDVGYNDENARRMTEFTIAYTQEKEKELTKSDIISLYKKHVIDREAATDMLQNLTYSETDADLILTRADYEVFSEYKKKRTSYVEKAFVAGKITESTALQILGELDLPSTEINFLLDSWELERETKIKTLTLENLKAFYQNNVITMQELRQELLELGYNDIDTNRFIELFRIGETT